jgi:NodT family efflux transporter outer membrane factor (OMF) lipoprotein
VVTISLRSSTNVRTALSRITEYRARRGLEKSSLFPQLTTNSSGRTERSRNRDTHVNLSGDTYQTSLDASWQADLFGQQGQIVKAAAADLGKAEEDFYGAQVSLAAEIASAYVLLRAAEAELAVVQRSISTRSETVQLTRWREQAGSVSALDTQLSVSILEQARASLPELQLTVAQTRNQLARLSGSPPGALDSLLARPQKVPVPPSKIAVGIPAEALRRRPDVRAAEHQVEAAFARRNAAQLEQLPSLTLNGTLGLESTRGGRLFSPETTDASLIGSLAAPIFDAGRIRSNIMIQTELDKQAIIAYEAVTLTALEEGENALVAIQRYSEKIGVLATALVAAREAATLSGIQYQAGQISLLETLDTQRTLLSLEQQNVTAAALRASACIQLYKALGGGWTHQ